MPVGDVPHHELEGRQVVGGLERARVAKVDLVLARRDFVVPAFDLEAHGNEVSDDYAADLLGPIDGCEVEVAAAVVRACRLPSASGWKM